MSNIFDVARLAGVSKSTVSRVFTGNGYVSKASRKKVLQAAKKLGYVPSILARQLVEQSTKTIGFIAKTYYPEVGQLLDLVTHYVQKKGFKIAVYFTRNKQEELLILKEFKLHGLDALFFVANRNSWKKIAEFSQYGPIVTWRRIDSKNIYSSYIDHYPLYKDILKYLKNRYGDISVGHILNDPRKNNTKARIKAIKEFKLENSKFDSWEVFYSEQTGAGESAAMEYLKLEDPPEAVIAYSDYVAAGFISTLRKYKKRIPTDVKVFGFDNSDYGKYMEISTIDSFLSLQIKNDMNKIICRLENTEFKKITIQPKMIIRKTC